jgi:hypothetical protein
MGFGYKKKETLQHRKRKPSSKNPHGVWGIKEGNPATQEKETLAAEELLFSPLKLPMAFGCNKEANPAAERGAQERKPWQQENTVPTSQKHTEERQKRKSWQLKKPPRDLGIRGGWKP